MQEFNMGKLLEKKEIAALSLVFLLIIGLLHFPQRTSLPSFSEAMLVQGAIAGTAAPVHSQIAAQLVAPFASVAGAAASSPDAIVALLLELSPFLLAASALFLYLALRVQGSSRSASAFISLLAAFLLSKSFLPGVYGAEQMAAPFFALFLLSISIYNKGRKILPLAIAVVFAAISAFISPSAAIAGAAVCVPLLYFGFSSKEKKGTPALYFLPLVAFAACALASPSSALFSISLGNAQAAFSQYSLLIAFAALAVCVFLTAAPPQEPRAAFLALLGLLSAAASPLCAALVLALPAASGIESALNIALPKKTKLLCAFAFGFFAIFAVAYSGGDNVRAAVVSLMVAVLFPLVMHFYDYENKKFFAVLALASLAFAFSAFEFSHFSPGSPRYVQYSDSGFSTALSSLSIQAKGKQVYIFGNADMAKFYMPSAAIAPQDDFVSFLMTGKPAPVHGSIVVLSPAYFDSSDWPSETSAFSSYQFTTNVTGSDGSVYAIFASAEGSGLLRQLAATGGFALRDGSLLDSSGQQYYSIPFSRIIALRSDIPYSSPQNRMIVLDESALPPYFLKIYSGKADGISPLANFSSVSVYKVG